MKTTLQLLLLLIPFFVFANGNETDSLGAISGSVYTADEQPAASVTVQIKNSTKGAIADSQGKFKFNGLKAGSYVLSVSLLGYGATEVLAEVKPKETARIIIQLQVTYEELSEVIIRKSLRSGYVETTTSDGLKLNLPLIEIPQNIFATNKVLLSQQGLVAMSEAFRNVSGVQKTYGGLNDYSFNIRGTDATLNVFRNGIGGYWWNQQEDVAMIDKIEFIKGPASFLVSNAEPGGFVNVVTKQPVNEKLANVNAGIGSYRMKRLAADIGGSIDSTGKFSYRFNSGIHYQQREFQYSSATRFFVCAALQYEPNSSTSLTAEYNYAWGRAKGNNEGLPSIDGKLFALPRNFTVADASSHQLTSDDMYYRLQLNHRFNTTWWLNAQVAYVYGNWGGHLLYADSDIPVSNDTLYRYSDFEDWKSYSGVAQATIGGSFFTGAAIEHKPLFGVDVCYAGFKGVYGDTRGDKKFGLYLPHPSYNIDADSLKDPDISDPYDEKHGWAAVYVQDHIKIMKRFVLTIAARYTYFYHDINNVVGEPDADDYEKQSKIYKVTPRLGLTWLVTNDMSLYVLFDKSFWPQFGKNRDHKPFDPLTGYNTEAGFKGFFLDKKLNLNLSAFYIVKNNTLTADPLNNDYLVQRGQIISKGIDVDMTGALTPSLAINANYEFVDAAITKDSDPDVVGIKNFGTPAHSGNLWLRHSWWKGRLKGFSVAAGYQYVGKKNAVWYYNPDPDTRFFPSYHLLDAALSYSQKRFHISLNVYNIANVKYAAIGSFTTFNEWRYTPGEPVNFRLNVAVNLLRSKRNS